ncbi:MAG: acetate/propionate family kinase [Verrucomicrobia bacterium]|nr:acetate/propionate family kinase [Verrucomicrobiota bacterium]
MSILVINAGSTSLKFALLDREAVNMLLSGVIDWSDGDRHRARLVVRSTRSGEFKTTVPVPDAATAATRAIELAAFTSPVTLLGHRVVHGGTEFSESRLIDAEVKAVIARLARLAPLHNPPALAAIEAAEAALPGVPQVAVFDTAFFARLPARAFLYPLPYEWFEKFGVRRIGFHGISHGSCAARAAEMLGRPASGLRLVTCHLGGGCSATAVCDGAPVSTTMGFTPLEGLMMGTRAGSIDPGVLIHLQRHCGLGLDEIDHALNHRSGFLGVSGFSSGSREIETAMQAGHERARLAFEMFADRVRATIGALAVGMGGLDALVFTAAIGERSPLVRAAVCDGLGCLGLRLDPVRNEACAPDCDIAVPDSPGRILVVRAQEERVIAQEARRVGGGRTVKR